MAGGYVMAWDSPSVGMPIFSRSKVLRTDRNAHVIYINGPLNMFVDFTVKTTKKTKNFLNLDFTQATEMFI